MTDSRYDTTDGDELTPTQGSPSSPSPSSAHPDSAPDPASAGEVAEDSIRGAFPPEEDRGVDDSSGPSWVQEEPEGPEEPPKDTFVAGAKSFFLDSKEERAAKKAAKGAGGGSSPKGKPRKGRSATAVAPTTKVSRRARLLGGKRGRATALMALMIAVVVLTVTNSILIAALFNKPDAQEAASQALREQGRDFPSGKAAAWAEQVVVDWATWDEADPEEREVRMAQYLTSGMDPQAGWNERDKQTVEFTSVNPDPVVVDESHALVEVAYRLDDNSRRCVTVPVYAHQPKGLTGEGQESQWAFGLSGNPVPRPCEPRTGAVEDDGAATSADGQELAANDELAQELTANFFPDFFAAWAASDANSLRQYTASGVTTIGLGGAMSSTPPPSIGEAVVMTPKDSEPREGTVYDATVPVTWTTAGGSSQVTATYRVPMKLVGDRWYVAGEPRPSARTAEAASGAPAQQVDPEEGTGDAESPTGGESPAGAESPSSPAAGGGD